MKAIDRLLLLIFIMFIAAACSREKTTITKPVDKRNNENVIITREFYTNDRKTKFILYNEAQLNDNRLIKITNEIQEIYHS